MRKSINISRHSTYISLPNLFVIRLCIQYGIYRSHLCGYDFNITYPQQGKFPQVGNPIFPTDPSRAAALSRQPPAVLKKRVDALIHSVKAPEVGIVRRDAAETLEETKARDEKRRAWLANKNSILQDRDLSGRANGSIDLWYGCFLSTELQDYALNFSMPWSTYSGIVTTVG